MEKTKFEILNEVLESNEILIRDSVLNRRSEIQKLTARIAAEQSRKEAAERKAAEAESDSEMIKQAAEAQSAGTLISLLEKRIEETNGQELISPEKYSEAVSQIRSSFEGARLEAVSKLRELAEEMDRIGQELTTVQNRTNAVLKSLQVDLNGNRPTAHINYAGRTYVAAEAHSVNVQGLILWASEAVHNHQYTGQSPANGFPGKVLGRG